MTSFEDQYIEDKKIAEGTYGIVYKIINKTTNIAKALKKIYYKRESSMPDDCIPSYIINEILCLTYLNHPNIIKYEHFFLTPNHINIILPYYKLALNDFIETNQNLSSVIIKHIMKQILSATHYMHSKSCIHRDLKSPNILIDSDHNIKIIDFSISKYLGTVQEKNELEVETLYYRAPELLFGETSYDYAIDIWSIGCIYGELLKGSYLFTGNSEIEQIYIYCKTFGIPTEETWPNVSKYKQYKNIETKHLEYHGLQSHFTNTLTLNENELLHGLLTMNPKKRLLAHEALSLIDPESKIKHVYDSTHENYYYKYNLKKLYAAEKQNINFDITLLKNLKLKYFNQLYVWLEEVNKKFRFLHRTLNLSFYLLDLVFQNLKDEEKVSFTSSHLQLYGSLCLQIASEQIEIYPSSISDFKYQCTNTYSKNEFMSNMFNIFKIIKFNMFIPTPILFLESYLLLLKIKNEEAKDIIIASSHNRIMFKYKASVIAASALFCSQNKWSDEYTNITGYNILNLNDCIKDIVFNKN